MTRLDLRAASAVVDITPAHEILLGANDSSRLPWAGVGDPLEANLVALSWDGGAERLLLVTLDLLYASTELRTALVSASGLSPEKVIIASSHTHRAPMIDQTKPKLGTPDPSYVTWLTETLAEAVRGVTTAPTTEVRLTAATSRAAHSINRRRRKRVVLARRPRLNAVVNAPNASGVTDETIVTFSLRDTSGRTVAAFWNYACHPVASPPSNSVSSHFPGIVRARVRSSEKHSGLAVLYFQGFSGNTRPSASVKVHSWRRRVRRFISGPLFESMTNRDYLAWANGLARVVLDARAVEENLLVDYIASARVELASQLFYAPAGPPVSFVSIRLGHELQIVGMSGEVVAEYASDVRASSSSRHVACVGCLDQPFGYVPTGQILSQGGYEAGGFCESFSLTNLNSEIEKAIRGGFAEVME